MKYIVAIALTLLFSSGLQAKTLKELQCENFIDKAYVKSMGRTITPEDCLILNRTIQDAISKHEWSIISQNHFYNLIKRLAFFAHIENDKYLTKQKNKLIKFMEEETDEEIFKRFLSVEPQLLSMLYFYANSSDYVVPANFKNNPRFKRQLEAKRGR